MEALYSGGDELVQSEARSTAGGAAGGTVTSSGAGAKNAPGVTVELINEMIRRKPQNVGVALRNWVDEENKGADS